MREPPLILIVEDHPASLEILAARLTSRGYDVITAADGEEGLARAQNAHPDLILMDIMMPKLDGIEVCRRIRADTALPFMPVIMVTARADSKDIVAGLEAGADEYLTKPVDQKALVARVQSMLRIKALHDTVVQQSAQLRQQLKTAAKVQSLFWPESPRLNAGSHVWAVSVPAGYVGGDLYDIIPLPDGSLFAYVADVSGKGVPAALVMAALSSLIRIEAMHTDEADTLLNRVNRSLFSLTAEEGFFATIALARYWPSTGRMEVARGGHFHPLLVGGKGLVPLPEVKGVALGLGPNERYEKIDFSVAPGESAIFYSDGVIEAENDARVYFGTDRLIDCVLRTNVIPRGRALLEGVQHWRGRAAASDDLTILEIWRS